MDESQRMWMEKFFNRAYLVVIWGLVMTMRRRRGDVALKDPKATALESWAFALLALGDTSQGGFVA